MPTLFETKVARGRTAYKVYAATMLAGMCSILFYRLTHFPESGGGEDEWKWWCWVGMLAAEFWFGFYWVVTQSLKWNPIYRRTFKKILSQRYEKELPPVDVFVCTADPTAEPPLVVVCTVLSVMAYDYPPEKLAVYLSDDGGSDITFYALVQASRFAKVWIPFCRKFNVEPRSPAAYFSLPATDHSSVDDWKTVKKLYEEMRDKIEEVVKLGRVPQEMVGEHKGFLEWNSQVKPRDHPPIVQILIDGRRTHNVDDGDGLPTLVYMSREKSPHVHHNYKAGAMNSLIRASSEISNGPIILNVDCDMYSNNSASIRDALCFFMDESVGHEIAYVQYPQFFHNITPKDLYANALNVLGKADFEGFDGMGGPPYIGTGCFHRRESLHGLKYYCGYKGELLNQTSQNKNASVRELEERAKAVVTCTFEDNTEWGKELGLKYGCVVEDIITGLAIQCRGWRSVAFNPTDQPGFLGLAPTNMAETLVQHKRWSEGNFQIFLSKHCSFVYGHGKITFGHQMAYNVYGLWATNCFPTLCYVVVPPLCLLKGFSLFPEMTSPWCLIMLYVIISKQAYSLMESLMCGDTLIGWWNSQRMWLFKRLTSYLFASLDVFRNRIGISESSFVVTAKGKNDEATRKYEEEVMDLGGMPPMFTIIIAFVALLNLFCLAGGIKRVVLEGSGVVVELFLQFVVCIAVVVISFPVYVVLLLQGKENGISKAVVGTSVASAFLACLLVV